MSALSDDPFYATAGYFCGQMAQFDLDTHQRKYQDTVQTFLALSQKTRANFSDERQVATVFCGQY
jgi:hypothetical protein